MLEKKPLVVAPLASRIILKKESLAQEGEGRKIALSSLGGGIKKTVS